MDEHLMKTYRRYEPVFVRGKGVHLYDEGGRAYLDFLSGIGVTALGHAHPRWVNDVRAQAGELAHVSNLFRHLWTEALASRLAAATGMEAAFFVNSGSESIETALKIARKAQAARGNKGRTHFVALEGGFHGRTFGAISVTATKAYREPFQPTLEATFVAPGDEVALAHALASRPAALVLEPIQGEGGLRVLPDEYLRAVRRLCDETGTILIHDEVQCGGGRTGRFLAGQWAGVAPDLVTLAKPLGGGLPIGVTLASKELADVLVPGDHGSTFGGGPLVSRAALAFLEELENGGLLQNVAERGAQLERGLDALCERFAGATERRGRGLMLGLVLPGKADEARRVAFEHGLIVGTATGDVLRMLPPFILTSDHVEQALERLTDTLEEVLD